MVDRARPKTDDPCYNFSADLLSRSLVDTKLMSTDNVDTEHSLKNNQTGKNGQPLSSNFDDSNNEGTSVIDIPPSAKDQRKHRTKQKGKSIPHLPPRGIVQVMIILQLTKQNPGSTRKMSLLMDF